MDWRSLEKRKGEMLGKIFKVVLVMAGFGAGWYGRGSRGRRAGEPIIGVSTLPDGKYPLIWIRQFPEVNESDRIQENLFYHILLLSNKSKIRYYIIPVVGINRIDRMLLGGWDYLRIDRTSGNTVVRLILREATIKKLERLSVD